MAGSADPSAMTATSEGPAKTSMPTLPNNMRLASATNLLPGPTMMSAGFPVNKSICHGGDCLNPAEGHDHVGARYLHRIEHVWMHPVPWKGVEQATTVPTPAAFAVATDI